MPKEGSPEASSLLREALEPLRGDLKPPCHWVKEATHQAPCERETPAEVGGGPNTELVLPLWGEGEPLSLKGQGSRGTGPTLPSCARHDGVGSPQRPRGVGELP